MKTTKDEEEAWRVKVRAQVLAAKISIHILMPHFTERYADQVNRMLHNVLSPTWCYKQEIFEVAGLVTALFITYDGVRDDSREIRNPSQWGDFIERITGVDPDWDGDPPFMEEMDREHPEFVIAGWLRRTIYTIKAGQHPEQWTAEKATEDTNKMLVSALHGTAGVIQPGAPPFVL